MVRDTPQSQDVSTYQIWNPYLKQSRRYAPDTKQDGRTDGQSDGPTDSAITISLLKFLWGQKIQKGQNMETDKSRTIIPGRNVSSLPKTHSYKIACRYHKQ